MSRTSARRRAPSVLGLGLALLCAWAVLVPANAAAARRCGDIPRRVVSGIVAANVTCPTARSVANSFASRASCYQRGCRVSGFNCARKVLGYESYRARCTASGSRVIRFYYGA